MECSKCEVKRSTCAAVKHEDDDESSSTSIRCGRLKTFSSEKIGSDDDMDKCDERCGVPTEAPRTQEMERSPYRIPASVFEKSPSSCPMEEWSTASNESLFSIHTGNMSFTNDQLYMWRSGDLTPSTSDQMFSYHHHDSAHNHHMGGLAEATMLEVIKESENQNPTKSLAEVRHARSRRSHGSNTSNTSFAFSIMGADPGSSTRLHSSLRSNQEQPQIQTQPQAAEPKTSPVEAPNQAQSTWFSCFSCCTSVSK